MLTHVFSREAARPTPNSLESSSKARTYHCNTTAVSAPLKRRENGSLRHHDHHDCSMLTTSNLRTLSRNPSISNLSFIPANPRWFPLFVSSMASSLKVVAEYSKSNRSLCKICKNKIAAHALRLGLVSRGSGGFDLTKWHHLDCFPLNSESIASAEAIKGFSSLKSSDQETLKKLVDGGDQSQGKVHKRDGDEEKEPEERDLKKKKVHERDEDEDKEPEKRDLKKTKVQKRDEDEEKEPEKRDLKKTKDGAELDLSFSISDIKNKYKDATLLPKWKAFQTIIFLERDDGLHDSKKIAAFDFDGCLAKTSVKRVGPDAWSLMYPSIPEKLQSLYNDDYKLVIFTNESNIERWKKKRQVAVDSKIGRLNNFIKQVKVPIQVFIACGLGKSLGQAEDPFRKPKPGMWRIMEQHFNSGIEIDMNKSFYVGDAAGRHNDHSDADIKFAQAIGLKFYVPEEYFSG